MSSDIKRKAFEKRFPVPGGIFWNEVSEQYDAAPGSGRDELVEIYHGQWVAWQAARAQGSGSWIKCSDRLPEPNEVVIVHTPGDLSKVGVDAIIDGRWEGEYGHDESSFVTHWMPLPQPPCEQGGDDEPA